LKQTADCFAKGLLKKITPDAALAQSDIAQAEFFLSEALDLIELPKNEMAFLALYNAVFHAGRALLYLDGIKEKSHHCLQKYLEEKYCKHQQLHASDIALFDVLRGIRQEVQYGVAKIKFEENPGELADKTEHFIQKTKRILKSK